MQIPNIWVRVQETDKKGKADQVTAMKAFSKCVLQEGV